ncbi:sensor histidine kinase [Saccharicrinis fermentans]|uniref:sensor histidine kinase n=1 Tax=Saccharicrinis fermentans TaxID=982 RepID=UPI0005C4BF5D|nr:sensor histidine kinase [Saccharicrinis fermentans]
MPLFSQSEYGGFENLRKKDGLFHLNTTSLYKDSKGFLWVGSTDGLMRYDGSFFDVFRRGPQDTSALSDNSITCIIEDQDEYTFWIGTTWGGLNRFDIVKNTFKNYQIEALRNKRHKRINCIYQLSKDTLLVGTDFEGLFFFIPSTGKFSRTNCPYPQTNVYKIADGSENIWIVSSNGLMCFSKKQKTYINNFSLKDMDKDGLAKRSGTFSVRIRDVLEIDEDRIVFTTGNSLFEFNIKTHQLSNVFTVKKGVILKKIVADKYGNYWVASIKDGLFFYHVQKKKVTNYKKDESDIYNNLPFDEIKDMLFIKDQEILFVATKNGLLKYDYHKNLFKRFNAYQLTNNKADLLTMVFKDSEGTYWIGTNDGKVFKKNTNDTQFGLFSKSSGTYTYQIIQGDNHTIWFVTNLGLRSYHLKTKEFKAYPFKAADKNKRRLNHLHIGLKENNHTLWLLGYGGLIRFNTQTHAYETFDNEFFLKKTGLIRFVSLDFSLDKQFLWFSERDGNLFRFQIKTGKYEKINTPMTNRTTKMIVDVEVDKQGKLWIATFGSGVLIYNPETDSISNQLAIKELESYVYGILSDNNDHMWVSSNFGISKVNTNDMSFLTYDMNDGSLWKEFNKRTYYKGEDGILLFGGDEGFIEFDPAHIYQNPYNKAPQISAWSKQTRVSGFMSELYEDVTYIKDTLVQYHKDDGGDIKFFPSVLNYSHSSSNRVSWKLEGYSTNWTRSYTSEPIVFNNLKSGKYVLRVKGINNHGIESKDEARLNVIIIPSYYETLWFKLGIFTIILLTIYAIVKVRTTWYSDQKKVLLNMVNEKTKEISTANKELERTKEEILNQNVELNIHRNYLEDLVKIRTRDLEKAKLKAEESDRLKTSFLANLSHEIRTPMNAIIGFSSLIQLEEFPEDQKKELIYHIGQSSETLLTLIDDIIDISRIETGNIKLSKQQVNIPDIIKETIKELSFEDRSTYVAFVEDCSLAEEDQNIYSDKQRLKQVLSNLIRNAFKFTKVGHVKLTVKRIPPKDLQTLGFENVRYEQDNMTPILFQVEDTGIGIEESDLDLIFQPFQKANRNKVYKGMGLGLSIVKNIIQLLGGEIIVKSNLDQGTTFSFYINAHFLHSQHQLASEHKN